MQANAGLLKEQKNVERGMDLKEEAVDQTFCMAYMCAERSNYVYITAYETSGNAWLFLAAALQ